MLTKIEVDMSREWLIMLQDYCVKAESGNTLGGCECDGKVPPRD